MRFWPFKTRAEKAHARAMEAFADFIQQRSFDAARIQRTLSEWHWDGGFDNTDVISSLPVIRSRSRDMAKNSPLYARFIQLMRENVVGDGFRFKSLPFMTDADPEVLDRDAAKRIEYHWWRWSRDPSLVDSGRRQSLVQLLALAVENWTRDGEAFILLDSTAQNRYGLSLRVIRADCVDETISLTAANGNPVRGGIEFDRESNRPVAYYFNGDRADVRGDITWNGKKRMRIPAENVIHLFERHDADQVRGVPLGYSALIPLKMLDEYTRAELTAARAEACTVGVFKTPYADGQPQFNVSDAEKANAQNRIREGQNLWLPPGFDYASHTPNHPNRGWVDYSVGLQRMIATGLGVDFTELTGNAAGAISAVARQSMLRTREMYKDRQRTVSALVLDRMFHAWLRSFLRLAISGDYSLADFNRLCDHEFQGRRWGWIDPSNEVNAASIAVAHGWRTDAEVAAEYGNDIDDTIEEATRIKDRKAEAGLLTAPNGQAAPAQDGEETTTPDKETEDDQEKKNGRAAKGRAKRAVIPRGGSRARPRK